MMSLISLEEIEMEMELSQLSRGIIFVMRADEPWKSEPSVSLFQKCFPTLHEDWFTINTPM